MCYIQQWNTTQQEKRRKLLTKAPRGTGLIAWKRHKILECWDEMYLACGYKYEVCTFVKVTELYF